MALPTTSIAHRLQGLIRAGASFEAIQQLVSSVEDPALLDGRVGTGAHGVPLSTPLEEAIMEQRADVVRLLLDRGANLATRSAWGWTLLHFAAAKGDKVVTELLLERKADPNSLDDTGSTPSHIAAYYGNIGSLRLLVRAGANLHIKNQAHQITLLQAAVLKVDQWGDMSLQDLTSETSHPIEMIRYLFEQGIDPLAEMRFDIDPHFAEEEVLKNREGTAFDYLRYILAMYLRNIAPPSDAALSDSEMIERHFDLLPADSCIKHAYVLLEGKMREQMAEMTQIFLKKTALPLSLIEVTQDYLL